MRSNRIGKGKISLGVGQILNLIKEMDFIKLRFPNDRKLKQKGIFLHEFPMPLARDSEMEKPKNHLL